MKHLVFPETLCVCGGKSVLRGFSLSNLENVQPSTSPEPPPSDPFVPVRGSSPKERSHVGACSLMSRKGPAEGFPHHHQSLHMSCTNRCCCLFDICKERERPGLYSPLSSGLLQKGMSSITSFFGRGGNKQFIQGNVTLVQTFYEEDI